MIWRLCFLLAFLLPDLPLDPAQGDLAPTWCHPLGTDPLGRDSLLRLLLAGARSLGFATAAALGTFILALPMSLGEGRWKGLWSTSRAMPPMLILLPLAALTGGLSWSALVLLLALCQAPHMEAPLAVRMAPFLRGPAWAQARLLGASPWHHIKTWTPWVIEQIRPLFPSAWLGALWGEATLRLLGLGPGPQHDSLGLLMHEELPRLSTDPTALGVGALLLILLLAASSGAGKRMRWTSARPIESE